MPPLLRRNASVGEPTREGDHAPKESRWIRFHIGRHLLAWCFILGIAGLVTRMERRDHSSPSQESNSPSELSSLSPREISRQIESTVHGYLRANTVEARLPFVRRASNVHFLMHDHARRYPLTSITDPISVHVMAKCDQLNRHHQLYLAAAETEEGLIPLMVEAENNTYLVDGESHAAYSPMDIEAFLKTPAGSSMWFRVHATRSDYHNHHFNDQNETMALRLAFPESDDFCYAYLHRHHPQFNEFARILKGNKKVPLILSLNQKSQKSGHRRQLEIASLKHERWFIEQASTSYAEAWGRPSTLAEAH
jgi:hypothetical protein